MRARRVITSTPVPVPRLAEASDAPRLMSLLEQLGYPAAEESVRRRLELNVPNRFVVVAELDDALLGLAVVEVVHPLHRGAPDALLTALVTDAAVRHRGVARLLLLEVSRLARHAGCRRLELTSHRRRDDAHGFYRSQGFDETHLSFHRLL